MDIDDLIGLLRVEASGPDHFVGHSPPERDRQVYGGQFLGQALAAAAATVEAGRAPHSLHAYFLRTGAARTPIDYRVERIRDGRTASHRSVVATQDGREVFRQLLSFQIERPGPSHPPPLPRRSPTGGPTGDVDPTEFVSYRDWVADLSDNDDHPWFAEDLPVELRLEDPPPTRPRGPMEGDLRVWMRLTGSTDGSRRPSPGGPAGLDERQDDQ